MVSVTAGVAGEVAEGTGDAGVPGIGALPTGGGGTGVPAIGAVTTGAAGGDALEGCCAVANPAPRSRRRSAADLKHLVIFVMSYSLQFLFPADIGRRIA